jgi:ribonucleoside-diphosphate reductase beta chain
MLNGAEHTNFFENRATEYSKASTQGAWESVFSDDVFAGNYARKIGGVNMSQLSKDDDRDNSVAAE